MTEMKNGGPAFPVSTGDPATGHQNGGTTWQFPGMSLLDHFAGLAMQELLNDPERADQSRQECAHLSYLMAYAMLEERRKATPPQAVERKVYRETPEHSAYLRARFATPGARSFEWEGHRWAYRVTSFDDAGDYDLIWRTAATGGAA